MKKEKGISLIALTLIIVAIIVIGIVAIVIVSKNNTQNKDNPTISNMENVASNLNGNSNDINSTSSSNKIQVGDKVNYNELSNGTKTYEILYTDNGGKSSENSQTLTTDDLEWRVLNIKEDGTIELISTNPTETSIYLYGVSNGDTILDNTCNQLYGKGNGAVSARNLKIDDIDILANITTDEQKKSVKSSYGSKWLYRFSNASNSIECSSDNGVTWKDTTYSTFEIPEGKMINSSKQTTEEIVSTSYDYSISNYINKTTTDGIDIATLIAKGENKSEYVSQWLSSEAYSCNEYNAFFDMFIIRSGWVKCDYIIKSNSNNNSQFHFSYRPVVTLKSDIQLVKDSTGVWQIN